MSQLRTNLQLCNKITSRIRGTVVLPPLESYGKVTETVWSGPVGFLETGGFLSTVLENRLYIFLDLKQMDNV